MTGQGHRDQKTENRVRGFCRKPLAGFSLSFPGSISMKCSCAYYNLGYKVKGQGHTDGRHTFFVMQNYLVGY